MSSQRSLIEVQDVEKSYTTPSGASSALRGVSLTVPRGRMIAITGKSGSGRSTLLNVIAGIDRVTSGSVQVDGVTGLPAARLDPVVHFVTGAFMELITWAIDRARPIDPEEVEDMFHQMSGAAIARAKILR